jgi:hypothetical protein
VTSWHSLLGCAQAEVTIERIVSLAAATGTEPLTVDFKEKASPRLAECVASMANAHGGLIFVGITDTDRTVTGVKTETMAYVADMLSTRLDPADWLPEMFEVPLGSDRPGMHILVLRIRRELAPRPLVVQRTAGSGTDKTTFFWIPVRIPVAPVRRPGLRWQPCSPSSQQARPLAAAGTSMPRGYRAAMTAWMIRKST